MSEAALPEGVTEEHVAVLQALAARDASLCLLRPNGTAWIGGSDRTGGSVRYPALPARLRFEDAVAHGLIHDPEGEDVLSVYDLTEAGRALAEAVPPIRTRPDLKAALTPRRGRPGRAAGLLDGESRACLESLARATSQGRKDRDGPLSLTSATFAHDLEREDMLLLMRDDERRIKGSDADFAGILSTVLEAMPGIRKVEYDGHFGAAVYMTVDAGPDCAAQARAASAAVDERIKSLRRRRRA